jgi:hypothetical protein
MADCDAEIRRDRGALVHADAEKGAEPGVRVLHCSVCPSSSPFDRRPLLRSCRLSLELSARPARCDVLHVLVPAILLQKLLPCWSGDLVPSTFSVSCPGLTCVSSQFAQVIAVLSLRDNMRNNSLVRFYLTCLWLASSALLRLSFSCNLCTCPLVAFVLEA